MSRHHARTQGATTTPISGAANAGSAIIAVRGASPDRVDFRRENVRSTQTREAGRGEARNARYTEAPEGVVHMRNVNLTALVAVLVVSCSAEDDDPPPPAPPLPVEDVTVVKIAGDGQTIAQHLYLNDALEVRAVDRQGVGLPGLTVGFTAGPGSGGFGEWSNVTDQDGWTFFRTYFHTAGDQQVVASVDGYRPAAFVVHVAPAGTDIDGVYDLGYSGILRNLNGDPSVEIPAEGAVAIGISDGELFDPNEPALTTWIVSGSFSATDGSLDVTLRQSPDIWSRFTGALSLDGDATGGSGTWIELWRGTAVADTGGTWMATRR